MGRFWGLKSTKPSRTALNGERAALQNITTTINCACRTNYEPRGRGFKSCRARQTIKGLQKCRLFFISVVLCPSYVLRVAHERAEFAVLVSQLNLATICRLPANCRHSRVRSSFLHSSHSRERLHASANGVSLPPPLHSRGIARKPSRFR